MTNQELLNFCLEKGFLIDRDILNQLSEFEDIETIKSILEKINFYTQKKFITKNLLTENKEILSQIFLNLPDIHQKKIESLKINLGLSIEILKEVSIEKYKEINLNNFSNSVKILSSNITLNKKIEVSDFVKYFKNRFLILKNILQNCKELQNLVSINKISGNRQGFSLIAMISDKRITKNKNILLEIEDLTGKTVALINQNNKELYKKAEELTLDSVIGIKCSGERDIVFVNDLILPETFLHERKNSLVEEYALFIGDLHIGGKNFMESNFLKFIDYLNGKVPNTPEVEKIKYLFIVGDLIAGVGIYPGQEKDLSIPNIEDQYQRVGELLGRIRSDIQIIAIPGNHDALRIMEPQPLFDEKYAWPLYNLKNLIIATNPSTINIGAKTGFSGFNVLLYHGYSFHYYANTIPYLMKEKASNKPELIMDYLLRHRHLAPTHSSTLYFPSEEDSLLIKEVPDIFFSGHTHKSGLTYHNNILVISSSCWERKTSFQEKMGNEPDFCKVPMFNLKTRSIKILDFEEDE